MRTIQMMRLIQTSAAISSLVLLAGCETLTGLPKGVPPSEFCQVARPISWSSKDTRATKEQVDAYNRVGKKLCGWGRK